MSLFFQDAIIAFPRFKVLIRQQNHIGVTRKCIRIFFKQLYAAFHFRFQIDNFTVFQLHFTIVTVNNVEISKAVAVDKNHGLGNLGKYFARSIVPANSDIPKILNSNRCCATANFFNLFRIFNFVVKDGSISHDEQEFFSFDLIDVISSAFSSKTLRYMSQ